MTGIILFFTLSCISILLSAILAVLFWRRRSFIGSLAMSLMLAAASEWALFCLLSDLSSSMPAKLIFDDLSFIGVVSVPMFWFIFSIFYTRQDRQFSSKHYILLAIIPATTLILKFARSKFLIHEITTSALAGTNLNTVEYTLSPWYFVHTTYSYSLILIGMLLLISKLLKNFKLYQNQTIIMISAALIPFLGALKYSLGLGPYANLDMTTFCFSISGVLLFIGMFKYRLLDLIPIAREAIIETMSDLVIVLDPFHRIIDLNNSARDVFSKGNGNLIGQPIVQVIDNFGSQITEFYDGYSTGNEIAIDADSQIKYYNVKHLPLYNKRNLSIGSFLVLSNITDLKQTMADLNLSKQAAESANKAKSDFLATMSHEIRTPINGIIGMSELLESAELDTQEKENLSALQYSANSLLYIINEILDFSKIESGKIELESKPFNIRRLLASMVNTFTYKCSEGLVLTQDIDQAIPEYLLGDSAKLGQILTNLVSNAFKFTELGEISIRVQCLNRSSGKVLLCFRISDTGVGIPQDKLANLFQSFHQLDSSTTRKYGGTGLGLSIVKKLVELMQGTIRVESELDKGSSFIFQVPFMYEVSTVCNEVEEAPEVQNRRLKILVAEDSKVNQALIKQLLEKKGWQADIAANGLLALDKLKEKHYDLILMDIQMPEMDGYQATYNIRHHESAAIRQIPIIALTANATNEDKELCLSSGMNDFLAKPIKSEKLYECIQKHIKQ